MRKEEKTMDEEEKEMDEREMDAIFRRSKSKIRKEIETLLKNVEIAKDGRVTAINMNNNEAYVFDELEEAVKFINMQKGRWYVTSSGIKHE